MAFAESFIRGFTRGQQVKTAKDREAREVEQQKADLEYREGQVRRQSELDRLSAANQQIAHKLTLFKLKEGTEPTAVDVPGLGMRGPTTSLPGQHAPVTFDMSAFGGGQETVTPESASSISRRAVSQRLAEAEAVGGVKQRLDRAPLPVGREAAGALGVKPGEFSPTDLAILTKAMQEKEATRRASIQKAAQATGSNEDDVAMLLQGGTADKLPIKVRSGAVAAAKASGGVDGTGFVPMNTLQQQKYTDFSDLRSKAVRLKALISDKEVASKLGPIAGRVVGMTKEMSVIGQNAKVKEAFDLLRDLSDTELRKRSGAAISPGEYSRITGFTVDPNKQADSNMTNLKRMLASIEDALENIGAVNLPGGRQKDEDAAEEYLKKIGR